MALQGRLHEAARPQQFGLAQLALRALHKVICKYCQSTNKAHAEIL